MRSRYTAYALGRYDYLLETWHPDTRPENIGGTGLQWIGLQIVRTEQGCADDDRGMVEFIASYIQPTGGKQLHECSRFVCENGAWFYVDGDCSSAPIGRNGLCPCGSGRKFKRCCGSAR